MRGWFKMARPFAKRRARHRLLALLERTHELRQHHRHLSNHVTDLWRDFIAHMRGGE